MNEIICSVDVVDIQFLVSRSIEPMQNKTPLNGAKITSCFVITICLTPKITPNPPRNVEISAGISSIVSLGAVLEIQNTTPKDMSNHPYFPPISGNG